MRALPRLLDRRTKITAADIARELLSGSWKALVLPKDGGVDRSAWVFCVLTAFHWHLMWSAPKPPGAVGDPDRAHSTTRPADRTAPQVPRRLMTKGHPDEPPP
jgi:hypothetical protein